MSDPVEIYIEEHVRVFAAEVDRAVERAIQGGKYGVLVVTDHMKQSVSVSPLVEYGHVAYVPIEGLNAWIASRSEVT